MDQGYTHPDRLLAVLDYRQQREIEIYAGIEPIGGMVGVSSPPEPSESEGPEGRSEQEELKMFEMIRERLVGKEKRQPKGPDWQRGQSGQPGQSGQ